MPRQQFNTREFSWAEVTVQIEGRILTGIQGLSYETNQDKEYSYGKGDMPQSIQRGNIDNRGEIRLKQSELEILIAGAPNNNLLDYRNLNIQVAYQSEDGQVVSDSIVGAEFTSKAKNINQNDKLMQVSLPIMFLRVDFNV